ALLHSQSAGYPELLLKYVNALLNEKDNKLTTVSTRFKKSVKCYARYEEYLKGLPNINLKSMKFNDSIWYSGIYYETNLENNKKTNDSCILFQFPSLRNEYQIGFIAAILSYAHNNDHLILVNRLKIIDEFTVNTRRGKERIRNLWIVEQDKYA
ncbi:unnamed protein product, partial [Didymodactylos carnosus]